MILKFHLCHSDHIVASIGITGGVDPEIPVILNKFQRFFIVCPFYTAYFPFAS